MPLRLRLRLRLRKGKSNLRTIAIMVRQPLAAKGTAVHIMTSEEAQANFSKLIDNSQREPVLIVRSGKPVSFVISPDGDQKAALVEFLQVVRELVPLTGKEASKAARELLSRVGSQADADGLTEADIARMIDEGE